MTEQTLRERLAEIISLKDQCEPEHENVFPDSRYASDWSVMIADAALSVFREWLDSKLAEQMIIAVKEGKSDEILSYLNDRLTAVQDALGGQHD